MTPAMTHWLLDTLALPNSFILDIISLLRHSIFHFLQELFYFSLINL